MQDEYGVRRVVKLSESKCDCCEWDISGIPCKHACAAILWKRDSVEKYCHAYFSKDAYIKQHQGVIHAVSDERYWPLDTCIPLSPPILKRHVGRPKTMRAKEPGESTSQRRCKMCGEVGHLQKRCPGPPRKKRGIPALL